MGRADLDKPTVGDEHRKMSWLDLYRHFAGAAAPVPAAMKAANERAPDPDGPPKRELNPLPQQSNPPPPERSMGKGAGPHFYNDGEQAWFRNTFCNGAQNCVQGWDWAYATSHWQVNSGTGYAMVGSEGHANATFTNYWWECSWGGIFAGWFCTWMEFWQGIVLPGHWISVGVNGNGNYIQWSLAGAGGGTQVSVAARY